jgi:hypothetical protein
MAHDVQKAMKMMEVRVKGLRAFEEVFWSWYDLSKVRIGRKSQPLE